MNLIYSILEDLENGYVKELVEENSNTLKGLLTNTSNKALVNLDFLFLNYLILLKGLEGGYESEILYYLDNSYSNIDLEGFVSEVFLDRLGKSKYLDIVLEDNLLSNIYILNEEGKLKFAIDYQDESFEEKKGKISKISIVFFTFYYLVGLGYSYQNIYSLFDGDYMNLTDIEPSMKDTIINIINSSNQYKFVISNKENYIREFNYKVLSYFEEYSIKNKEKSIENIISTFITNLLTLDNRLIKGLIDKGLSIQEDRYKSLNNKNFIKHYFLLIFSEDIEEKPFFRKYISTIKEYVSYILNYYYSNNKEQVVHLGTEEINDDDGLYYIDRYRIDNFNLYEANNKDYIKEYGFNGLQYYDFTSSVLSYILKNNLSENNLQKIYIDVDKYLQKYNNFIGESEIKTVNILYKLYINDELIETKDF